MRHPPIACRRAVQSLQSPAPQHIWISDEQLSVAVNRFFRTTCPNQTRHGSHVPGPLEARRRATKRRMTVSASFYPQDNFPPPFSLGALFGFRKDSQPSWRYEPPSFPQNGKPLDLAPDKLSLQSPLPPASRVESAPSLNSPFPTAVPYSSSLDIAQTVIQHPGWESLTATGAEIHDAKQASSDVADYEACFETFKSRVAHASDLSVIERNRLLSATYQACCPSHPDAWIYSVMVVKHLMECKWDPAPVFRGDFTFVIPPTYTTENQDLLECLEQISSWYPHSLQHYHRLYLKLAKAASCATTSATPMQDSQLLLLIRQLWRSACSQSTKTEHSVADLLRTVASKLMDTHCSRPLQSILANATGADHHIMRLIVSGSEKRAWFPAAEKVLSCIPQERLVAFVPSTTSRFVNMIENKTRFSKSTYKHRLSTWLKLIHRVDTLSVLSDLAMAQIAKHVFAIQAPTYVGPDLLLDALLIKHTYQHTLCEASIERLSSLIASSATRTLEHGCPVRVEDSLALLFSQIERESLPYQVLAEPTVALVVQHADLGLILRFLTAMERQRLTMRDASIVDRLITNKVAVIQQRARPSGEIERQHDAFALRTCQRIFEVLSKIIAPSSAIPLVVKQQTFITLQAQRQFKQILDRARANHALPLTYRNLTANAPLQQQVDLIHQLAHHYSLDTTRSYLETCRAVYYLYNYLRGHSLPIGPLFTKAVVRVSITRPLVENRFVSARRLIWVCQLVAKVEGEDVAKRIENDFWHWRGDLLRYAKSVYVRVGGDSKGKAHIGTMKKLGLI
ncbi:hypothetical protein BKA66DRAFT_420978 [Pyrenochaeta sp. MPI-SDFR-AT-0127]|nr:hypothetical protein BKA66DRAFT_420978 [Pyrenochaeta sp. MPI-SDFR-AT-0127]